nr:T9SS type A sorting domain-containing protein [uncultured Draconibacterium sp.]
MRKLFILLAFSLFFIVGAKYTVQAQTTHYHYKFSYDDSGNREQRIYIGTALKSASIENSTAFNEEKPIRENLGFGEIKIYPNPTKGNLIVEIPDFEAEKINILVFNLQGKEIMNKTSSPNSINQLSLYNLPSGMYVLKIVAGQESSDWKIIKD